MSKNTQLAGVTDHSTMGLNIGTEMPVSKECFNSLKKAMHKASQAGLLRGHIRYEIIANNQEKGLTAYRMHFIEKSGKNNMIVYDFFKKGNNYFINVSGNPSKLIIGANDVPALVIGSFYEQDYNAATVTFKYMNRVMYSIQDDLLADFGFSWTGKDKRNLVDGIINITSYQIAWYSGNLGEERQNLLNYLRVVYGSLDSTTHSVRPAAAAIGLNTFVWDNSEGNLTIQARSGIEKLFSLTWYTKDGEPDYSGENSARLEKLIRWDCTFNGRFLQNKGIRTVKTLEEKYIQLCDKSSYDVGFIKFLANNVIERIKLNYLLSVTSDGYRKLLASLEGIKGKYEKMIVDNWLNYGKTFENFVEAAEHFGISDKNRPRYTDAVKSLKGLGLDIEIPRTYIESTLFARFNSQITREERSHVVTGSYNRTPGWNELAERDTAYADNINNRDSLVKVRKFKPTKVKPSNFWILQEHAKETPDV